MFKEATAGNTCEYQTQTLAMLDAECICPYFSVSISLLLKCLKQQSEVLHRHNLELERTNDALAQAYAMQGESSYCIKICK